MTMKIFRRNERQEGAHYAANKETGSFIEEAESIDMAKAMIRFYEDEDKKNDVFEPNFYDVVNENHESLIQERIMKKDNIIIRVSELEKEKIKAAAKSQQMSVSEFMIAAVRAEILRLNNQNQIIII